MGTKIRLVLLASVLVASFAPVVSATELTFAAVEGGALQLRGEIGFGNWLTDTLYDQGALAQNERVLESFSFLVSSLDGSADLTYRTAVGVLDGTRLDHDAWTSDWQTIGPGGHEIEARPGSLALDPSLRYILYMIPAGMLGDVHPWSIETTLTNRYPGIVGVSPQLYTDSDQVDLDLAQDRDVAMTATIVSAPEPSSALLLLTALLMTIVWKRKVRTR